MFGEHFYHKQIRNTVIAFGTIFNNINIKFVPVLSRAHKDWKGATGYVQDVILKQHLNLNIFIHVKTIKQ